MSASAGSGSRLRGNRPRVSVENGLSGLGSKSRPNVASESDGSGSKPRRRKNAGNVASKSRPGGLVGSRMRPSDESVDLWTDWSALSL